MGRLRGLFRAFDRGPLCGRPLTAAWLQDLLVEARSCARAVFNQLDGWIVAGIRTCGEMFGDPDADPSKRDASTISVNPFGGAGDDVYVDEQGREIRVPKAFEALIQRDGDKTIRDAQMAAAFAFVACTGAACARPSRCTRSRPPRAGRPRR